MKSKKSLLIVLCAVLVIAATVVGTLAYLTDREAVTNTFTVGDVQITLDEAKVKTDGTLDDTTNVRVKENSYHLIPGKSYHKDPTMTVEAGSEPAYVRMRVVINKLDVLNDIFAPDGADLEAIFGGYDKSWVLADTTVEDDTITYEFRYNAIVDSRDGANKLPALFTAINMPGFITGDQLSLLYTDNGVDDDLKIVVYGDAIQAETFADADAAWAAFEAQVDKVND